MLADVLAPFTSITPALSPRQSYAPRVDTAPRILKRRASLTSVRAHLTRFQVAHGVTAANWVDAFRDESGLVQETDEYFAISGLYALIALDEPTS